MMQFDRQSRWQSWMRMLAVGIRAVDEPAQSIGFTKKSGAIRPMMGPLPSPLNATPLNVGRTHEDTD